MNRREFSKKLAAFAGAMSPLVSMATPSADHASSLSSLAHAIKQTASKGLTSHAVYDSRLAFQSIEIDRQFGAVNQLHTYQGDVTSVWYQLLDPLWGEGKIVTAGITRHTEFFLLRTMAGEYGHIVSHLDEFDEYACWLIEPTCSSQN